MLKSGRRGPGEGHAYALAMPNGTVLWLTRVGLGLLIAGTITGCGSFTPASPRARDDSVDFGRFPPDFAVSVTLILPGDARDPKAPPWVTPAWYVVEPDGQLRAREGVRSAEQSIPPLVRHLRHEEVAELWSTIRAGGLVAESDEDLSGAVSVVSGVSELPLKGVVHPTVSLYVSSQGSRRGYLVDLTGTDAAAGRARDLTARLAVLAGVGQDE